MSIGRIHSVLQSYTVRAVARRVKFIRDEYVESSLRITNQGNTSLGLVKIKCGYNGIREENTPSIRPDDVSYFVPLKPTNLRAREETRIRDNTVVLLEWDPPAVPTPLYQYTNVHYSVSPAAVSPPVRVSSESTSVRITLANDKSYRANVTYTNCAGGNSSFLRISIARPRVTVTDRGTGISSASIFNVDTVHEGRTPSFVCEATDTDPFTLEWAGSFPSGVTVTESEGSELSLSTTMKWNRPLSLSDSGQYHCNAQGRGDRSVSVVLNLLVRRPPAILYMIPSFPATRRAASNRFSVSQNQKGTILTCVANGFPAPRVEWMRDGEIINSGRAMTLGKRAEADNSQYSAMLLFIAEFDSTDRGGYVCRASTSPTSFQEKMVTLEQRQESTFTYPPVCAEPVDSNEIFFIIRFLETSCASWDSRTQSDISRDFLNVLKAVVMKEKLGGFSESIQIRKPPICSVIVRNAAVIVGSISTSSASNTAEVYCAISIWHKHEPLVQITNNSFHFMDTTCSLPLEALNYSGCEVKEVPIVIPSSSFQILYISGGSLGALTLLVCAMAGIFAWATFNRREDY